MDALRAYTIPQLARATGLSEWWLRRMVAREDDPIPHVLAGERRPVAYIREAAFAEWIERQEAR